MSGHQATLTHVAGSGMWLDIEQPTEGEVLIIVRSSDHGMIIRVNREELLAAILSGGEVV